MNDVRSRISMFNQKNATLAAAELDAKAKFEATKASRTGFLPVDPLVLAGMHTSKNPLLQYIYAEVIKYNQNYVHPSTLGPADAFKKAAQLDSIYYVAFDYISSKWQRTDASKRARRWSALEALLNAVGQHFEDLGLRRITGTNKFGEIDDKHRNYWLERVDPLSRPGYILSKSFGRWLAAQPTKVDGAGKTIPKPFFEWLALQSSILDSEFGPGASAMRVQGYNDQVAWDKSVHFDHGIVRDAGDGVFSTQTRRTEFAGAGWAIWVCSGKIPSPNGRFESFIFSNTHIAGDFHHSTFLGGAPVMAAGEWIVDAAGKVCVITAKSGHYKPSPNDMLRFIHSNPDVPRSALIRPDLGDFTTKGAIYFYTVADFAARGPVATPVKRAAFRAMVPNWAAIEAVEPGPGASVDRKLINLIRA